MRGTYSEPIRGGAYSEPVRGSPYMEPVSGYSEVHPAGSAYAEPSFVVSTSLRGSKTVKDEYMDVSES